MHDSYRSRVNGESWFHTVGHLSVKIVVHVAGQVCRQTDDTNMRNASLPLHIALRTREGRSRSDLIRYQSQPGWEMLKSPGRLANGGKMSKNNGCRPVLNLSYCRLLPQE